MSAWRPSADHTAATRFKYEPPPANNLSPARRSPPPGSRTRGSGGGASPPRRAPAAGRGLPADEQLLAALADMQRMVAQNQQRLTDMVTEIRQDARDEAGRLWRALGKEPPEAAPVGPEEAAWHRAQARKLQAMEAKIDQRADEAAQLRAQLRALGDDIGGGDSSIGGLLSDQAASPPQPGGAAGGAAGRPKGVPFRPANVPSAFQPRQPPTPPSDRLDRALAAREAALDRELASIASMPPLPGLKQRRAERIAELPPHWLPPIAESAAASGEVRHALAAIHEGLDALLGDDGGEGGGGEGGGGEGGGEGGGGEGGDVLAREDLARAQFEMYDVDGSGAIELSELTALLVDTLGGLSREQCAEYAKGLFQRLDAADGASDGRIEWPAFRGFYKRCLHTEAARKQLAAKAAHKLADSDAARRRARQAFGRFDVDGSGTLSQDELGELLRVTLGSLASELAADDWDALVADAMRRGDKDASGAWDLGEFEFFFSKCLASDRLVRAYERKLALRYSDESRRMEADVHG